MGNNTWKVGYSNERLRRLREGIVLCYINILQRSHTVGVLIDNNRRSVDLIDGCGWRKRYHLAIYRWARHLFTGYRISIAFPIQVQHHDHCCTLWPIFYASQVAIKGNSRTQIKRVLAAEHQTQHTARIRELWDEAVAMPTY